MYGNCMCYSFLFNLFCVLCPYSSTPKVNSDLEEEARERNNDSLFAEMYGTSPEFIADVDEGADLQGTVFFKFVLFYVSGIVRN